MASTNSTGANRLINADLSPGQAAAIAMELGGYQDHGNSTAAMTVSIETGVVHKATLNANCTISFDGAYGGFGSALTLVLVQDGTGSRTVTWTNTKWAGGTAPTLSTAAGAVDILSFFSVDGGTTWYGFTSGLAMA